MSSIWITVTGWTTSHLLSLDQPPAGRWRTRCGRNETRPQRDGNGRKRCSQCARLDEQTWRPPRVVPSRDRRKEPR